MVKLLTLIGVMSGVSLLFYFGGVLTDTANSVLLDMVLNPERFQTAELVSKAIAALGILIGISTLVFRQNNGAAIDQYLMISFVYLFLSFGWDFLSIFQQISSAGPAAQAVATLIFGPLMLMYVMAIVEWWRGVST